MFGIEFDRELNVDFVSLHYALQLLHSASVCRDHMLTKPPDRVGLSFGARDLAGIDFIHVTFERYFHEFGRALTSDKA
jgi:hypothetical protein